MEGPWLLALCHGKPAPQLLVFNLLLPRQDPRSWRILDLPLPLLPTPQCYTQCEEALAEYPEFSVDPAQRIFVVYSPDKQALVTPVGLLIRRIDPMRTSPYIPWNEWGEDVVTVHLEPSVHTLRLFDTKVVTLSGSAHHPKAWGVRMYDFSRSGRTDIQSLRVSKKTGVVLRRILSTPKWFVRCQMGDGIPHVTRFVGSKVVCFFVSSLWIRRCSFHIQCYTVQDRPTDSGREYFLRIWKMG